MKDIANYIESILALEGINIDEVKHSNPLKIKLLKKLKKQVKEIEYMRRTGGITIVVGREETVITTYHTASMKRKSNKLKVIYWLLNK